MADQLRTYQQESLHDLRLAIKQKAMAIALQLPTGSGKTTLASAIMQGAVNKGNRAFFICDSIELVEQAQKRFVADGMDVGIIQADHPDTNYMHPVQVGTIQTLRSRWPEMPEKLKPSVLVIDEMHVLFQAHIDIIEECKAKGIPVLGLSATPFRKGLGLYFDKLVVGVTTQELIDLGFLVPAICYAPYVPELKNVKTTSNGDWQADALAELMGEDTLVGDVVENWFKLAEGRLTLVFATNVAHSRALCDAFTRAGVVAEHIDGYERDPERRADIINRFRNGEIRVLVNVGILTKGFDAPECSCIVIARPTKSLMLHIQMLGRPLRVAPGKTNAIVIDHAGNVLRNGLPTDPLPRHLDGGAAGHQIDRKQREKDEPLPKPCGACGHISIKHVCPLCGFKPEVRKDVEVRDGQLYEVTSGETKKWSTEDLAQLYAEFLGYARLHGKKDGWAYHQCREYVGRAPAATRQIKPAHPSNKTLALIKHLQIKKAKAYAKQKEREAQS